MNEQEVVKASLLEIFKRNGFTDPGQLTQRHYDHISSEIEKKSGTLISGTTIRRLSNGEFTRMPQVATLNAIANYLGFKSWQDYKLSVQAEPTVARKRTPARMYLGMALLLIVMVSIVAYTSYPTKNRLGNFDKAVFNAHKNTANDIPNTVVFNYDIDNVDADSFFIQQSWDKNRRIRIHKNTHTVTDIYYEPGYHVARLIANDSIIKAVGVSIPTDRWFFYANENKIKYKTEYIKTDHFVENGVLALTAEDLRRNRIETEENKLYLYSYFPGKFEVNSDDYTLSTRVRMKEVRNNLCPYIALEVYCQRFFMMVKSTSKGCASEAAVLLPGKDLSGKQHDLSSIAYDLTQWTDVELVVKNKHAVISINGKESFSTDYVNSGNLITGLSFISNGLCEVDRVELTGSDGKVFYRNDFDGSVNP